jgi:hypothetical protein
MQRNCPCGKPIAGGRDLCDECYAIYGRKACNWPAWLRFYVNDTHREYQQELDVDRHQVSFTDLGWNSDKFQ